MEQTSEMNATYGANYEQNIIDMVQNNINEKEN